jgi:hypothetical protein
MGKVIRLTDSAKLDSDPKVIVSVEEISPDTAAAWLRCNRLNRPVRRNHVAFLAREIESGLWQMNGQPIVISENEDVLDGQHRLLAVIESGITIKTLVVYGIGKEAFKTIDTGAARSGADALSVWFPGRLAGVTKSVAAAVVWCASLERNSIKQKDKLANAEVIEYVTRHPSLWKCAETLQGYPKETRLISIGCGTGLYEMFQRKNQVAAAKFMRNLYVGEMLTQDSPEFVLRAMLAKDQTRITRYSGTVKARMVIKAWNLRRRGIEEATIPKLAINPKDSDNIVIF